VGRSFEDASVIVVMGVSGCGKSTVGQLLAQRLGLPFAEGDDFHPAANVAKMRSGLPLDDADRQVWLQALGQHLARSLMAGQGVVLSCSALKRSYRDQLRLHAPGLQLLHLVGSFDLLMQRMAARKSHYMPASLLHSQFADLQPPDADERAQLFEVTQTPQRIVQDFAIAGSRAYTGH
jgi:gluconokinase